jgi:hypothetical protein
MSKPMTVDETYNFWKLMFDHLENTAGYFIVADEMEVSEPEALSQRKPFDGQGSDNKGE